MSTLLTIGLRVMICATLVGSAAAQSYRLQILDSPPGYLFGIGRYISDAGHVAVSTGIPSTARRHAALWYEGTYQLLGTFVADDTMKLAGINAHGVITGQAEPIEGGGGARAFRFVDGVLEELPTPPGYPYAGAGGSNDQGSILIDLYTTFSGVSRGSLWRDGTFTFIDAPDGGTATQLRVVNERHTIAGWYNPIGPGTFSGFVYRDGTSTHITALQEGATIPSAVNDNDVVVGYSGSLPFIWHDGTTAALPLLPDGLSGVAQGINDAGIIVGECRVNNKPRATLWTDETVVDLNDLLNEPSDWQLEIAYGINNNGLIVGRAVLPPGFIRPFILHPLLPTASRLVSLRLTPPEDLQIEATPSGQQAQTDQLGQASIENLDPAIDHRFSFAAGDLQFGG